MKKIIFLSLSLILFSNFCLAQADGRRLYTFFADGRFGYVDSSGDFVIEPKFDTAGDFFDDLARVTIGGISVNNLPVYMGSREGYIDRTGKFVIEPGKFVFTNDFSEGLAGVQPVDCHDVKKCNGYIDTKGKIVISPQFQTVGRFKEGTAAVRVADDKWGLIDKTGKFIMPPIYDGIIPVIEGIGIGFIIKNRRQTPFDQKTRDFETMFFDLAGNITVRLPYFVIGWFSEGRLLFVTEKGSGFLDKSGKVLIEPKFANALMFSEGLCAIKMNNKWGYIDKTGNIVIEPQFEKAYSFNGGLGKVITDGKTGFIDFEGRFIIEPQNWFVGNFENGEAFVEQGDYRGYIDKTGKFIWKKKWR